MDNLTYLGVFLEGMLSFVSPCILPLIPLYMSYLSSGAKEEKDGKITYNSIKVLIMTLCFVLGISTTFFLMGLSIGVIKDFIKDYQTIISIIGGVILIVFALNMFGILEIKPLSKEHKIDADVDVTKMNYLKAYVLGFIFSFAWTPCVGPMLTSVILLASSSDVLLGNLLIGLYALGFTIPFILVGFFYQKALSFIKEKQQFLIYLSKIAAVIILIFGASMIYDGSKIVVDEHRAYQKLLAQQGGTSNEQEDSDKFMMYDFKLTDQYGDEHQLSDYKDKYVILNFVSSWCGYCKQEIPHLEEFANNNPDIEIFYVMSEDINASNGGSDTQDFIDEHDVKVRVLNDDGQMFAYLGINSFPMMVFIGPDGSIIGYQSGMMDAEQMQRILKIAQDKYNGN